MSQLEASNSNFANPATDYLLDKLSAEELEIISEQIVEDLEKSAQGKDPELSKLAHVIEEYVSSLPQANPENLTTEKAAALNFVKSAAYIDGFINEACGSGLDVTQAIDLYDYSLSRMLND